MMYKDGLRLVVALATAVVIGFNLLAASGPPERQRVDDRTARTIHYTFPDGIGNTGSAIPANARSLGRVESSATPVGAWIGDTWWDMQHYGSMGRMVDWGYDTEGSDGFMIHFNWMRLETIENQSRHYAYNVYYADGESAGTFMGQWKIQATGECAGFVGIDVTTDGRAVLGGHNNRGGGTVGQFYWDFGPGFGFFGMNRRIPDTMWYIDHNIDTVFETY